MKQKIINFLKYFLVFIVWVLFFLYPYYDEIVYLPIAIILLLIALYLDTIYIVEKKKE